MRIIIMGTGPFAVPSANKLLVDGHDCPLVVTRPIVETAGMKRARAPMFDWADANGLPVFQPADINEPTAIAHLTEHSADLFFVCDYGQILSRECLAATTLGGINLHGSILPKHRGAAPVQWALLCGDSEAGVSVIHITPKLDGGPVLSVVRTPIEPDENAQQLEARLSELGVAATCEAIESLSKWNRSDSIGAAQDAALVTKAPRFSKADGELDFRFPAAYLVRLIRALQPWPGTFGELNMGLGRTKRALIRAARCNEQSGRPHRTIGDAWPLTASDIGLNWTPPWHRLLAIQCDQSLLLVSKLQPAGRREMTAEEFLRGHLLDDHARFALPNPPTRRLAN